ncbi:MAG: hypothetical protein JST64_06415 [Actinobacteria bacterium]|nr:hypothetical protein [Actinomycetota bacterium]
MALSERSRSVLYQGLVTIVDEQAVQEMMSYFPARDVEEPVTKEFFRAEMALMRTELVTEIAGLRTERAQMEGRLVDRINRSIAWNVGTMIALSAVLVAALRF